MNKLFSWIKADGSKPAQSTQEADLDCVGRGSGPLSWWKRAPPPSKRRPPSRRRTRGFFSIFCRQQKKTPPVEEKPPDVADVVEVRLDDVAPTTLLVVPRRTAAQSRRRPTRGRSAHQDQLQATQPNAQAQMEAMPCLSGESSGRGQRVEFLPPSVAEALQAFLKNKQCAGREKEEQSEDSVLLEATFKDSLSTDLPEVVRPPDQLIHQIKSKAMQRATAGKDSSDSSEEEQRRQLSSVPPQQLRPTKPLPPVACDPATARISESPPTGSGPKKEWRQFIPQLAQLQAVRLQAAQSVTASTRPVKSSETEGTLSALAPEAKPMEEILPVLVVASPKVFPDGQHPEQLPCQSESETRDMFLDTLAEVENETLLNLEQVSHVEADLQASGLQGASSDITPTTVTSSDCGVTTSVSALNSTNITLATNDSTRASVNLMATSSGSTLTARGNDGGASGKSLVATAGTASHRISSLDALLDQSSWSTLPIDAAQEILNLFRSISFDGESDDTKTKDEKRRIEGEEKQSANGINKVDGAYRISTEETGSGGISAMKASRTSGEFSEADNISREEENNTKGEEDSITAEESSRLGQIECKAAEQKHRMTEEEKQMRIENERSEEGDATSTRSPPAKPPRLKSPGVNQPATNIGTLMKI